MQLKKNNVNNNNNEINDLKNQLLQTQKALSNTQDKLEKKQWIDDFTRENELNWYNQLFWPWK